MTNIEKCQKLKNALETIGEICREAAEEIRDELESRPEFHIKYKSCQVSRGKGKYRNYVWILIKERKGNKCRMISLDYSDIDKQSGNIHSLFGKIQFCKNLAKNQNDRYSPNDILPLVPINKKDTALIFGYSKLYDPKQEIYNDTYDPKTLANEFLEWK